MYHVCQKSKFDIFYNAKLHYFCRNFVARNKVHVRQMHAADIHCGA